MQVYNYAAFARAFELGVTKPNMTKIAKALFEPIVSLDSVANRVGNPYVIDSKYAKAWYESSSDIPENIKKAAVREDLTLTQNQRYLYDAYMYICIGSNTKEILCKNGVEILPDQILECHRFQEWDR